MVNKFDSMTIDSDLDSRMRLKQAMSSVHDFGKNVQTLNLNDALSKLETSDTAIDVIFIASRFSQIDITGFVGKGKATKSGQDSAYVLVLGANKQDTASVAQNVLVGTDGFLFEPYSVDQLLELTKLAARVKKERRDARERAAIELIVRDLISQLDHISHVKACNVDSGLGMKKFRELCSLFKDFDSVKMSYYYDTALRAFEDAPVPKAVPQQNRYGGVSSRIKKKLEEKILSDLSKDETVKEKA